MRSRIQEISYLEIKHIIQSLGIRPDFNKPDIKLAMKHIGLRLSALKSDYYHNELAHYIGTTQPLGVCS